MLKFQNESILRRAVSTEQDKYRKLGQAAVTFVLAHHKVKSSLTHREIDVVYKKLRIDGMFGKNIFRGNKRQRKKKPLDRVMVVFGAIYEDGGLNTLVDVLIQTVPSVKFNHFGGALGNDIERFKTKEITNDIQRFKTKEIPKTLKKNTKSRIIVSIWICFVILSCLVVAVLWLNRHNLQVYSWIKKIEDRVGGFFWSKDRVDQILEEMIFGAWMRDVRFYYITKKILQICMVPILLCLCVFIVSRISFLRKVVKGLVRSSRRRHHGSGSKERSMLEDVPRIMQALKKAPQIVQSLEVPSRRILQHNRTTRRPSFSPFSRVKPTTPSQNDNITIPTTQKEVPKKNIDMLSSISPQKTSRDVGTQYDDDDDDNNNNSSIDDSYKTREYFMFGQSIDLEESRNVEFKRAESGNPQTITNHCLKYVCGFLNSDGGALYFGIEEASSHGGKAVVHGVLNLETAGKRDLMRGRIVMSLLQMTPAVTCVNPRVDILFIPVLSRRDHSIIRYVLRIQVEALSMPRGRPLYSTKNISYVRNDHGIVSMTPSMIVNWARLRFVRHNNTTISKEMSGRNSYYVSLALCSFLLGIFVPKLYHNRRKLFVNRENTRTLVTKYYAMILSRSREWVLLFMLYIKRSIFTIKEGAHHGLLRVGVAINKYF